MTPCTVCGHRNRDRLDDELERGVSCAKVALAFGLSKAAVFRHKRKHLAAMITMRKEAPVASMVLAAQDGLLRTLYRHLGRAEEAGLKASAIKIMHEIGRVFRTQLLAERIVTRAAMTLEPEEGEGIRIVELKAGEPLPKLRKNPRCMTIIFQEETEAEKAERILQEAAVNLESRRHEVHAPPAPPPVIKPDPPVLTARQTQWRDFVHAVEEAERQKDEDDDR